MASLHSDQKMETARSKIKGAVIRDILPWIEENLFDEAIPVKTVTKKSGYGHWHFQRIFREQTGYNLAQYIRLRRVVRAAFSVAFTNKGILDIAIENGFSSQQNFSRIFKKYLNVPPALFRRQCSGEEVYFENFTRELNQNYEGKGFEPSFFYKKTEIPE